MARTLSPTPSKKKKLDVSSPKNSVRAIALILTSCKKQYGCAILTKHSIEIMEIQLKKQIIPKQEHSLLKIIYIKKKKKSK